VWGGAGRKKKGVFTKKGGVFSVTTNNFIFLLPGPRAGKGKAGNKPKKEESKVCFLPYVQKSM